MSSLLCLIRNFLRKCCLKVKISVCRETIKILPTTLLRHWMSRHWILLLYLGPELLIPLSLPVWRGRLFFLKMNQVVQAGHWHWLATGVFSKSPHLPALFPFHYYNRRWCETLFINPQRLSRHLEEYCRNTGKNIANSYWKQVLCLNLNNVDYLLLYYEE